MLDVQLFGMQASGHHAVSVLIHAANVALLFAILRALTGAFWRSALVAAIFALHPLRVESVAWAAERKDVLSLFFGLCAIAAYLHYSRHRKPRAYATSLGLFACALTSKAMLITLPVLLLLIDFWPLDRWLRSGPFHSRRLQPVLLEKLPFVALSVAASITAFVAQASGGSVGYVIQYSIPQRIANAFRSSIAYLGNMIWPAKLAVFYPYRAGAVPLLETAVAVMLVAAVTAFAIIFRRRRPILFVGWMWYLTTLLPVIGIIQVGAQSKADRYTYLPLIGISLVIAWGLGELAIRWPKIRVGIVLGATLSCFALALASRRQITT
jgi:hypothetical protein